MSSCLDAGGGQGKFENGLLQVPPFIPFYNRTILANGLFFAVLATRLEFNFQAKSTDFFGSLIHIIGHTRYIEKDGGRTRVFVDSLTLVCNPDPPSWNSFVGGTIRIGGKDYLITAAEPYSFFIVGFEQGCTLHDDDDDDRVKTRLDLTAATNAFADAYILVVDDGGGNPSNSGVGVEFVANRDSVGLVKDVIDQGVAQSCASETPNYWVGYVSTAHQGGDATKDHDPDTENVVVLGAATADDSTTQVGNGGDAAWVYVESTHDAEGVTGSGMVQRTAAHEMGHECGLDDAIGGKLMESGGRDTLFIGRDVNLLRCRIISPRKF